MIIGGDGSREWGTRDGVCVIRNLYYMCLFRFSCVTDRNLNEPLLLQQQLARTRSAVRTHTIRKFVTKLLPAFSFVILGRIRNPLHAQLLAMVSISFELGSAVSVSQLTVVSLAQLPGISLQQLPGVRLQHLPSDSLQVSLP